MKVLAAVLATLACAMLGLVATSTAATLPAHAAVVSAHVSPSKLGASGGAVEVTGTVRHAVWCQLKLVSHPSLVVVYSHNPKRCTTGRYSARVLIGSDGGGKDNRVAFALLARNNTSSFTRSVVLTVGGAGGATTSKPKPAAGSAGVTTSTTSTTVPATTTTSAPTTTSPVIVLPALPSPSGAPGPTLPPTSTTTTTAAATTTTTTTTAPTTTDIGTATTTSSPGSSTTTTSQPTTTTTAPTTTTGPTTTTTVPPSVPLYSTNWSGYAVASGPYDQIEGTFTVPALTAAATCTEHVAEWVGIDGWNAPGLAPNDSLIQAGVDASMTDPDTGTCTPGKFYAWPWWEILPHDETPIDSVTVNAGDQVTVSIARVSGTTTWAINLTDDTDGQSYTTDETYTGPGVSGEWVVEASSTQACNGTVVAGSDICQLAPYCVGPSSSCTGPVSFSNISVGGTETDWWQVFMVQNNATVATPSVLSANGFSVAYTGTQDAASQDGAAQDVVATPTGRGASVLTAGSQPRDKVLTTPISEG